MMNNRLLIAAMLASGGGEHPTYEEHPLEVWAMHADRLCEACGVDPEAHPLYGYLDPRDIISAAKREG